MIVRFYQRTTHSRLAIAGIAYCLLRAWVNVGGPPPVDLPVEIWLPIQTICIPHAGMSDAIDLTTAICLQLSRPPSTNKHCIDEFRIRCFHRHSVGLVGLEKTLLACGFYCDCLVIVLAPERATSSQLLHLSASGK